MEKKVVTFTMEKQTKNTYRYAEDTGDTPPVIGSLYVQKWALGKSPPQNLKITIESA